jgi:hypothetical protein
MQIQSTFIDDLKAIKKFYNSRQKPFSKEFISDMQRNCWETIKQCDFCKPSESELLKSDVDFRPLILKKSHGNNVDHDDYVFTCSYRTSQGFWRYEDKQIKKFASQYPYIEEIIRLAVFVKMEPCRCIIFIIKFCFEKYWRKYYPLTTSYEHVLEKFIGDFKQNTEAVLHSLIFREQRKKENLATLFELFSDFYPGTNFYFTLSSVLSEGHELISCGIAELSINAFIEKHNKINREEPFNKTANETHDIIIEIFESVFDILRGLSQHMIEKEGTRCLNPIIEDIDRARDKLKMFYASFIQDKQKGLLSSEGQLPSTRIDITGKSMFTSGLIDNRILRLINITEKYNQLGKTLNDDPYLILHN